MRWFKHMTASADDEKLSRLKDEYGLEGYGFWWSVTEVVAAKLGDDETETFAEFSPKKWGNSLGISPKKFRMLAEFCANLGLFSVEFSENLIRIDMPNILKFRDEYTERQHKKSGQNRDKLPYRARVPDTDTEAEKEEDLIPTGSTSTEGYAQAQVGAAGGIEHPVSHQEQLPGDSDDASGVTDDVPGIEFVELRELYDRMGRPEGPLSGFIEYKAAHKARDWPGIPRLTQAIIELSEAGAWNPGMAPGLGRFLRERWWNRDPSTFTTRASPGNGKPTANTQHQQDRQNMQSVAALGLELRRRREQNVNSGNNRGQALGTGNALPAGHEQG